MSGPPRHDGTPAAEVEPGSGPGARHHARRTCIACRDEEDRDDLVRLVRHPETGRVVVDLRANLPGRGAWVHPRPPCLEAVERQPGLLARALKEPTDPAGLRETLRDQVWRSLLDGLSLAAAGGGLIGGHDVLEAALREGRVEILVAAEDASERTLADLGAAAEVPTIRIPLTKAALGPRVGTASRAAVGVVPTPATHHLRRQLRRWLALG